MLAARSPGRRCADSGRRRPVSPGPQAQIWRTPHEDAGDRSRGAAANKRILNAMTQGAEAWMAGGGSQPPCIPQGDTSLQESSTQNGPDFFLMTARGPRWLKLAGSKHCTLHAYSSSTPHARTTHKGCPPTAPTQRGRLLPPTPHTSGKRTSSWERAPSGSLLSACRLPRWLAMLCAMPQSCAYTSLSALPHSLVRIQSACTISRLRSETCGWGRGQGPGVGGGVRIEKH